MTAITAPNTTTPSACWNKLHLGPGLGPLAPNIGLRAGKHSPGALKSSGFASLFAKWPTHRHYGGIHDPNRPLYIDSIDTPRRNSRKAARIQSP